MSTLQQIEQEISNFIGNFTLTTGPDENLKPSELNKLMDGLSEIASGLNTENNYLKSKK